MSSTNHNAVIGCACFFYSVSINEIYNNGEYFNYTTVDTIATIALHYINDKEILPDFVRVIVNVNIAT